MDSKERAQRFRKARTEYNVNGAETLRKVDSSDVGGVPRTTIYKLEKANDTTNVGYQDIVKLANHYGVNVAWLMGQPGATHSLDADVQNATKVTGLSNEAIEQLCSLGMEEKACLDALLTSSDFRESLFMLSRAKWISKRIESWTPSEEMRNDENAPQSADEYADMIESANYFEMHHYGEKMTYKDHTYEFGKTINTVSDRQLCQMYRFQGLQHIGNAFTEYAPADDSERKVK